MRGFEIAEPTLMVDESRCRQNIEFMVNKARARGKVFRPHFKTHQSRAIGRWFREYGVDKIAVSSVSMAEYFAQDGWKDITIAFPANPRQAEEIDHLSHRLRLNLLFDSAEVLSFLGKSLRGQAGFLLEIDTGQGRSGIHYEDLETVEEILDLSRKFENLHFLGFLTHAGHVYQAKDGLEVRAIGERAIGAMAWLKERFAPRYPQAIVSYGDTPTITLCNEFPGIDELRPGNFIFHDLMQVHFGVCNHHRIAIALACPVVTVERRRNRAVIHGGAVHLSKEKLGHRSHGDIYGQMFFFDDDGFGFKTECYLNAIFQEHGVISGPEEEMKKLRPGMVVGVYPVHSCLTADAMAGYFTLEGRILDHARAQKINRYYQEGSYEEKGYQRHGGNPHFSGNPLGRR